MFATGMSSSSSAGSRSVAARPRTIARLSAIAALCFSKVAHAQISGACEDVTGEEVNPDCYTEIKWATEHIKGHRDRYPAGVSSLADYQCALYMKGKINPTTGASEGKENYGCTLPPCGRLSPSMSSGDPSQAYNEVFSDSTPDFCTVDARRKNEEIAKNLANAPAPPPPPVASATADGQWQTPLPEERDGFEVGDHVKWVGADADVPSGSIGSIVGFNDDGINVQFDKGVYNFLPSELTMVSVDEAQAYEAAKARSYWTMWGVVLLVVGAVVAAASFYIYRGQSAKRVTRGARLWSPHTSASEGEYSEDDSPSP